MAWDAGAILSKLKMDDSSFAGGILKAQGLTSLLGNSISTFLANPMLGVANFAKRAVGGLLDVADAADKIGKMSKATGASTEFLSGLAHAAELSGSSLGAVESAFPRLVRAASEAAAGTGRSAQAFDKLGISAKNADGSIRNTEQLFMDAAQALSGMSNETEKAAIAQDIFGRSSLELMPLLNEGKGGIAAMIAEAKELGLTFDEDTAASAERFNDSLTRLKGAFTGVFQKVAMPLLEALAPILELVAKLLQPILSMLAKVIKLATEFGPIALLGKLADSLSGGGGSSSSSATPTVNVTVDPDASARKVADQVAPAITKGVRGVQYRVERSTARRIDNNNYQQGLVTG